MSEGPGQQQRYCTNCGAEIRPGNSFCTSCGTPLTPQTQQESGPTHPGSPPLAGPSPFNNLLARLRKTFSGVSGEDLRRLPRRVWEWFRDLPSVPKLVIVGSVLLVLLIILSPLAVIVAALSLGVSIIALIIRVAQRRSLRGWGIAALASLVLMFTFGAMSDVLYGTGLIGGSPLGPGDGTPRSHTHTYSGDEYGELVSSDPNGHSQDVEIYGVYVSPHLYLQEDMGSGRNTTYAFLIDTGDSEDILVVAKAVIFPRDPYIFPGSTVEVIGKYEGMWTFQGAEHPMVRATKLRAVDQQDESASRGGGGQPVVNYSASPSASPGSEQDSAPPYNESEAEHWDYLDTARWDWFIYSTPEDGALGVCRVVNAQNDGDLYNTQLIQLWDDEVKFDYYASYQDALNDYDVAKYYDRCDRSWAAFGNS
jgi:hypothetical protein